MHLFHTKKTIVLITSFLFLAFLPQSVFAEPVTGCHCFRNRAYDPNNTFAADDYILASTFNSLISRSFDLPKRQIVMLKMQGGVDQNDLLIGLETEKITGEELQKLLGLRKQNDSWQTILSNPLLSEKIKTSPILKPIQSGLALQEAGARIADSLIGTFYKVPGETLAEFRSSGLDEKEMTLLFTLSHAKGVKAGDLARQYQKEGKSWSEIADSLGIEAGQAGKLLMSYKSGEDTD
ncbi:MAG: hypothetical protein KQH63_02075 [Desulfobulbaceae bacterium]|nr:hypothetical protein [Desulfobulbaceae bacterium]